MFLAVQIKEAYNKPKHLNPVAVYDTYVGKSTEETKRNSLVSNDGFSPLPSFEELHTYLLISFSPLWCFHFLLILLLLNVTHIT